jgi:hypothetical protein
MTCVFEWDLATLKKYVRILHALEIDIAKRKTIDYEIKVVIGQLHAELEAELINWGIYYDRNKR